MIAIPPPVSETAAITAEQEARSILERLEYPDAQSLSSGDVIELANLIAEGHRLRADNERLRDEIEAVEARHSSTVASQGLKLAALRSQLAAATRERETLRTVGEDEIEYEVWRGRRKIHGGFKTVEQAWHVRESTFWGREDGAPFLVRSTTSRSRVSDNG